MKLKYYIKDKFYSIIISIFSYIIIILLLLAFKTDKSLIIAISIILFITYIIIFFIDYLRKKKFYTELLLNIENLDKAYLVLETLNKPEFYEGELLYQALYEINKSMGEFVNEKEERLKDFKEYIEMWIHEVKVPLSSLVLTFTNNKESIDNKVRKELKRLENYLDQVLYYVRSENAEVDYIIKEVDLSKTVKNVGIHNMDDLLINNIEFSISNVKYKVYTDSKWLEFILNQIINNSIKYKSNKNSYIKIYIQDNKEETTLIIEDNGIGIPKSDLKYVFNKTFTGSNGHEKNKSTGMGLYIAKKLCNKLGHKIQIESKKNKYTKVYITFAKNKYYDVLK